MANAEAVDFGGHEDYRLELELLGFGELDPPVEQPDGTWLMSAPTTLRVKEMLLHYSMMPVLLGEALHINDDIWRVVLRASLDVARAEGTAALAGATLEEAKGWPTWQMALFVTAGFVSGLVLGIIIGAVSTSP